MASNGVCLVILPLVSVMLSAATAAERNACHDGWLTYRNSCYLLSREKGDFAKANVSMFYCQLFHSELVDITDADENHFLKSELLHLHKNDPDKDEACYLTSGTDIQVEGEWEWANSGQKLTFTDWYPREPNNNYPGQQENCLCLFGQENFRWNDEPCNHPYNFICRAEQINHNSGLFG